MLKPFEWRLVKVLSKQKYLFASLLAFMLAGPIAGFNVNTTSTLIMYGVLTLVFITGPLAASRTTAGLMLTFALGIGMLFTGLSSSVFAEVVPFSVVLGVVFFAFLALQVGRDLLRSSTDVSSETLWMAVNVYILTGLFFAFVYAGIAIVDPDAFTGKFMDDPLRNQIYGFVYFSFVTLTTLGYGDLTPSNVFVATLTYMEALYGQLFIAIMVARLVGLYAVRG